MAECFRPERSEKRLVTIRVDAEVLDELDRIARSIDISRNMLIYQCIDFALKKLKLGEECDDIINTEKTI